jgi:hypothetical protein
MRLCDEEKKWLYGVNPSTHLVENDAVELCEEERTGLGPRGPLLLWGRLLGFHSGAREHDSIVVLLVFCLFRLVCTRLLRVEPLGVDDLRVSARITHRAIVPTL